jgi:capsular polysaccharide transport system ATP-binding protein
MTYAVTSNGSLLQLPLVSTFDVIIARGLLELATDLLVAVILLAGFGVIGLGTMPDDFAGVCASIAAIWAFGCGCGFINAVINGYCKSWDKIWVQLTRLLYFCSGIFYVPGMMPDWVRGILAWNPVLHAVDWFRSSFFAEYQPYWLDRTFLLTVAAITLLLDPRALFAPQPLRTAMIALERVAKAYRTRTGRKTVLANANAVFGAGHNFGILGVNGSDKSTLIRLLAGSEKPDRGVVRRYARVSFPLGFGGTFHGALSGRENAAFLARIYGARTRGVIDYVAAFSELAEYFDMPVNTYSAGMRARLAFAACLAIDFDVYLIDEVTEIGDQRFRRKCAEAFRERMARSDIILATHNPQTLRQYCDRGAVLADGALFMYDDIGAALSRYQRMLQDQH